MNTLKIVLALFALSIGGTMPALAQVVANSPEAAYIPNNMKPYFLVLLVDGDKPLDTLGKDERGALSIRHLAFIRAQAEAGTIVLVGPILGQGRIRGMAVMKASSIEEATKIEQGDPMIQRGFAKSEIHPIMLEDLSGIKFEYPR